MLKIILLLITVYLLRHQMHLSLCWYISNAKTHKNEDLDATIQM
jgi:hypothetical protein